MLEEAPMTRGACLCGAVRYEIRDDAPRYASHKPGTR